MSRSHQNFEGSSAELSTNHAEASTGSIFADLSLNDFRNAREQANKHDGFAKNASDTHISFNEKEDSIDASQLEEIADGKFPVKLAVDLANSFKDELLQGLQKSMEDKNAILKKHDSEYHLEGFITKSKTDDRLTLWMILKKDKEDTSAIAKDLEENGTKSDYAPRSGYLRLKAEIKEHTNALSADSPSGQVEDPRVGKIGSRSKDLLNNLPDKAKPATEPPKSEQTTSKDNPKAPNAEKPKQEKLTLIGAEDEALIEKFLKIKVTIAPKK